MSNTIFSRSAELRWFLPVTKSQCEKLFDWFIQDRIILNEEGLRTSAEQNSPFIKREDKVAHTYLSLPGANSLGIKKRNNLLEMKILLSSPSSFILPKLDVTGSMDQWLKWTLTVGQQKKLTSECARTGLWVDVSKTRFLQTLVLDQEQLTPAFSDRLYAPGCNIELTHLSCLLSNKEWLSFAFETFGASVQSIDLLSQAVDYFFNFHGKPPVSLNFNNAFNYPNWLANISTDKIEHLCCEKH